MLTIAYLRFITGWMGRIRSKITAWPGSAAASSKHSTGLRCSLLVSLPPVLLCYRKSRDGLISCFARTAVAATAVTVAMMFGLAIAARIHFAGSLPFWGVSLDRPSQSFRRRRGTGSSLEKRYSWPGQNRRYWDPPS